MNGSRSARRIARRGVRCLALAALAAVVGCSGGAGLPRSEQTVDGVTIYLGVVPAELVQGHSAAPGDPKALHGGAPPHIPSHHVMVALFDAASGARITDAHVRAGIGNESPEKPLEPMEVNDMMTYGNFFLLRSVGLQRIRVEILLTGRPAPIEADFAYEHEPGT